MKITISFLLWCTNLQSKHFSIFIFGLFFLFAPVSASAETTDLDEDGIFDHEDEEVVVSTNQSLTAGEYFFHNLTVASNTVLTLVGNPNASGDFKGVKITADNIIIESGSFVSANGTGYTSLESSPGAGESNGGYGYGGDGGDWHYKTSSALGGDAYGSAFEPKDLGSGGATNAGGGGALWLAISGTLRNDGTISANGTLKQASGGSVYVQTNILNGSGTFTANGATCAGWPYSGAGGGGRIAVYYGESSFTGSAEAFRGGVSASSNCQGERTGEDGTVIFMDTTNNDLYLYERLLFQTSDSPYEFNKIVLSNNATVSSEPGVGIIAHTVVLDEGSSFDTTGIQSFSIGNLHIDNASIFTSAEGQSLTISSLIVRNHGMAQLGRGEALSVFNSITLENESQITTAPMHLLHLEAGDITIDETSAVSVTGAGYSPKTGPGFNDSGAGASHGGLGERGTPSPVYGSETEPVDFGSGGSPDAYGGGALRMIVSGTLENNGTISADATPMKNGASGGSVYVTTNKLSGSGSVTALGGNTRGYTTDVGAGGGGRIAVYYNESDFTGTTSAKGGDRYVGGSSMNWYYAQDGTVVFEKEEPKGISSVLFIPGIKASRLYKEGILFEDTVWEPNGNGDIRDLSMSANGVSDKSLYTRDILREIYSVFNIYEGFTRYMDGLITDGVIENWKPFAYDWRYDVFDIVEQGTQYEDGVRYPVIELEKLAEDSFSGKVTIIAHSNGGLFAKALLMKLKDEGKANLVDKIILLASPQFGTPEAIGTILHGYDQKLLGGLVAEDTVVRSVTKNMPGVYGLVPSRAYFDVSGMNMVKFDNSESTASFRQLYGEAITHEDEFIGFMNGSEGRAEATTVHDASTANGVLLSTAQSEHRDLLDTWIAPNGVKVIEVVGVGINTVAGFEYTEFSEKICTQPSDFGQPVCHTEKFYKPVPYFTQYGDETVVGASAEGYRGEKETYYFDILNRNSNNKGNFVSHANITEAKTTQDLITKILKNESISDPYLSEEKPTYANKCLVFGSHSPVHLHVSDANGNRIGVFDEGGEYPSIHEDIPGSSYFELAGSSYVIVPQDGMYTAHIEGTGDGSMTLTLDTLDGEEKHNLARITLATITPATMAAVTYNDGVLSTIEVDEDGDGTTDYYVNEESEVIPVTATYNDLLDAIKALKIKKAMKTVLLAEAQVAEKQSVKHPKVAIHMLRIMESEIRIFMKKNILSAQDGETLINIIGLIIKHG